MITAETGICRLAMDQEKYILSSQAIPLKQVGYFKIFITKNKWNTQKI